MCSMVAAAIGATVDENITRAGAGIGVATIGSDEETNKDPSGAGTTVDAIIVGEDVVTTRMSPVLKSRPCVEYLVGVAKEVTVVVALRLVSSCTASLGL